MKQIVQSPRTGKLELVEVPAPHPEAGQVLVRTAYSVVSPRFHATVVTRLFRDATALVPVLSSMKQPVPYVFFANPGERHACPNNAAC